MELGLDFTQSRKAAKPQFFLVSDRPRDPGAGNIFSQRLRRHGDAESDPGMSDRVLRDELIVGSLSNLRTSILRMAAKCNSSLPENPITEKAHTLAIPHLCVSVSPKSLRKNVFTSDQIPRMIGEQEKLRLRVFA